MALASGGTLGTGTSSTSSTSFTHVTSSAALALGDFALLNIVTDNVQTTTGTSTLHSSVSATNIVATKLGEYTNGQSAAGAGVTTSLWLLEATGVVSIGATITMNLASAVVDKVSNAWKFTKTAGWAMRMSTAPAVNPIYNAINLAVGFGSVSFSGLPSAARLYFRGFGKEANTTTAITPSTSFTATTPQRSRNNASAVVVRGEFRINTSTGETSNPTMAGSSDGAGLFVALEEHDPRPVITGQPLNDFVIDGDTATFGPIAGSDYTGIQWQEYITSGGGGSTVTPLGTPINVSFGNGPSPAAVSVTIPAGANAWALAGTYFLGNALGVMTGVTLVGGTTQSLLAVGSASYMAAYGAWGKVNSPSGSSSSANLSIARAVGGNYVEGPTCQIQFFTVSDPDDWVRDSNIIADQAGPLTGGVATLTGDLAYAWVGGDSGFTIGSATGWTAVGTQHDNPPGAADSSRVLTANSVTAGGDTNLTSPTNTYATQVLMSFKGGGSSSTWDPLSGETGTSLVLSGVTTADDGRKFRAVLTNALGSTITNEVTLYVSPDGRLELEGVSTAPAEAPTSTNTKNITAPSGVVQGMRELILCGVGVLSGGAPTITGPAGWDSDATWQSGALSIGGGTFALRLAAFERKAPGAGATAVVTSSAPGYWGWHRTVWAFDAEDFIESIDWDDLVSTITPTLPAVTPDSDFTTLIDWMVLGMTAAVSPGSSGMTEISENTDHSIALYGKDLDDTTPVAARTYAFSPTADAGFGVIVLRSLASEGGGGTATNLVVADMLHAHGIDAAPITVQSALTVADLAHAHSLDTAVLSTQVALVLADLLHAHTIDAVTVTPVTGTTLAVADLAHAHSIEAAVLSTEWLLVVADMIHAHGIDAAPLSVQSLLAVADMLHAHTLEPVVLVVGSTLVVGDLTHAHTLDVVTLSTQSVLAVADLTHAHSIEAVVLSTQALLVVADMLHAHGLDAVTLTTTTGLTLTVADLLHAHALEPVALSVQSLLVVADMLHAHALEAAVLSTQAVLAPADLLHAHTLESLALSTDDSTSLSVADMLHAHGVDAVVLNADVSLAVADMLHAHGIEGVVVSGSTALVVADMLHAHGLESVVLSDVPVLQVADLLHAHGLESVALSTLVGLVVADMRHVHLLDGVTLSGGGGDYIPSASRTWLIPYENRVLVIWRENRVLVVTPEDRTLKVN